MGTITFFEIFALGVTSAGTAASILGIILYHAARVNNKEIKELIKEEAEKTRIFLKEADEALTIKVGEIIKENNEALTIKVGEIIKENNEALTIKVGEIIKENNEALIIKVGEIIKTTVESVSLKLSELIVSEGERTRKMIKK